MGDIKTIHGGPTAPKNFEAMIEKLRSLLALADEGNIRALAVVHVDGQNHTCTYANNGDLTAGALIGAVEVLKYDLIEGLESIA